MKNLLHFLKKLRRNELYQYTIIVFLNKFILYFILDINSVNNNITYNNKLYSKTYDDKVKYLSIETSEDSNSKKGPISF